jgi:hypothetical protein
MKLKISDDHERRLVDPNLHDGKLVGLVMSEPASELGRNLTLLCKTAAGNICNLTVPNIDRLRADNFLQGNIIFDVHVWEGQDCPIEKMKELYLCYFEPHGGKYIVLENEVDKLLATKIEKTRSEHWTLVAVSSSYGCELFAMSRDPADRITIQT